MNSFGRIDFRLSFLSGGGLSERSQRSPGRVELQTVPAEPVSFSIVLITYDTAIKKPGLAGLFAYSNLPIICSEFERFPLRAPEHWP